jgi:hypothetical protein
LPAIESLIVLLVQLRLVTYQGQLSLIYLTVEPEPSALNFR